MAHYVMQHACVLSLCLVPFLLCQGITTFPATATPASDEKRTLQTALPLQADYSLDGLGKDRSVDAVLKENQC